MATDYVYDVRVIGADGKVRVEKEFERRSRAKDFVIAQVELGRKVIIKRELEQVKFSITPAADWGRKPHRQYEIAPAPLRTIFIHTSVTKQLTAAATRAEEKAQMRAVDDIAFARGFNGFSYSFGVFASGRAYEGRGWRVVEAATEPYNYTSDSIVTVGNTDAFNPTEAQILGIIGVIKRGQKLGHYANELDIRPHRAVAAKACPGAKFLDATIRRIEAAVNA